MTTKKFSFRATSVHWDISNHPDGACLTRVCLTIGAKGGRAAIRLYLCFIRVSSVAKQRKICGYLCLGHHQNSSYLAFITKSSTLIVNLGLYRHSQELCIHSITRDYDILATSYHHYRSDILPD